VRPSPVVLLSPRFDPLLRVAKTYEPALVQALVPESPVEAFRIRVLRRFGRTNELKVNAMLMGPLIEATRLETTTVSPMVSRTVRWKEVSFGVSRSHPTRRTVSCHRPAGAELGPWR
jgi:hypothetical protein